MIKQSTEPEKWIYITVDKKLTDEKEETFLPGDEWKSPFIKTLFGIEGIIEVRLYRYDLTLKKAEVFQWEEITPAAVTMLHEALDPSGPLVKIDKDKKPDPKKEKK